MQGIQEWRMTDERDKGAADEAELLRAAHAGDRAALERLLARYETSLCNLCRGMLRHADDAEDAVQETFLRALRGLSGFRADSAFRTWLFRIAIHICLDWKRAHRPLAPWNPEFSSNAASPETAVLTHLRVLEALSALLPRQRLLLLLKEVEGWSVAEIAATLGWNEKRVQNELYKARRALADWREREAAEGIKP